METVPVHCTGCGAKHQYPADKGGHRLPCPKCRTLMDIPDEDDLRRQSLNVDLVEEPEPEPTFSTTCRCGAAITFKAESRGTKITCPSCAKPVLIPMEDAPPPQPGMPAEVPATWRPWVSAAVAPLVAGLGAWHAGSLGPLAIADNVDWALPSEFDALGRFAAAGAAVIWLAAAVLPALFLFRVEAARPGLAAALVLAAIAVGGVPLAAGEWIGILPAAALVGVAFLFQGPWGQAFIEEKTPAKNVAAGFAGAAILAAAVLGFVRWKEADRRVGDLQEHAKARRALEPLARALDNTEPGEPDAARTVAESIKQIDAIERDLEALRGRVPDPASAVASLEVAHARVRAHRITPLAPGAKRALKDRIVSQSAELRRLLKSWPQSSGKALRVADAAENAANSMP